MTEHQQFNGKIKWASVLQVFNATFSEEINRSGFADGLPNHVKLRSQYADKDRGRSTGRPKRAWNFYQNDCTAEEIQEMLDTADEVIRQEIRLSQLPRSIVLHPGNSPSRWSTFQLTVDVVPPNRRQAPQQPHQQPNEDIVGDQDDILPAETGARSLFPAANIQQRAIARRPLRVFGDEQLLPASDHLTLESFDDHVRVICQSPRLLMLHTTAVDFTSNPPTVTIDPDAESPLLHPGATVQTNDTFYCAGEVRRILLKEPESDRNQTIDCMLCDTSVCWECNPDAHRPFETTAWIGRQNPYDIGAMPLIHHKDLMEIFDGSLLFNPASQGPVRTIAPRGPLVNVQFSNGITQEVLRCNSTVCESCVRRDNVEGAGHTLLYRVNNHRLCYRLRSLHGLTAFLGLSPTSFPGARLKTCLLPLFLSMRFRRVRFRGGSDDRLCFCFPDFCFLCFSLVLRVAPNKLLFFFNCSRV